MEPAGDNQSMSLTYDVNLRDELNAKDLTLRMGELAGVSEVVLIASKNDVDY
jgi:hypothetical protein